MVNSTEVIRRFDEMYVTMELFASNPSLSCSSGEGDVSSGEPFISSVESFTSNPSFSCSSGEGDVSSVTLEVNVDVLSTSTDVLTMFLSVVDEM